MRIGYLVRNHQREEVALFILSLTHHLIYLTYLRNRLAAYRRIKGGYTE